MFCVSLRVAGVDHIILLEQSNEAWELWLNCHITGLELQDMHVASSSAVSHSDSNSCSCATAHFRQGDFRFGFNTNVTILRLSYGTPFDFLPQRLIVAWEQLLGAVVGTCGSQQEGSGFNSTVAMNMWILWLHSTFQTHAFGELGTLWWPLLQGVGHLSPEGSCAPASCLKPKDGTDGHLLRCYSI